MRTTAGILAATDTIDYQQKGILLSCSFRKELNDTRQAGVIPGFMHYMKDWLLFAIFRALI